MDRGSSHERCKATEASGAEGNLFSELTTEIEFFANSGDVRGYERLSNRAVAGSIIK